MKKQISLIHVNQHVLRANLRQVADEPMLTCKQGSRSNTYTHEVEIHGPSRFVNSMGKPLSCGARVWVQTESGLTFNHYGPSFVRVPRSGVTIIRVNQTAIRNNLKNGTNEPVLTCLKGGDVIHAHEIILRGPSIVRTANMSQKHEASIWVETMSDVECMTRGENSAEASCPSYCAKE